MKIVFNTITNFLHRVEPNIFFDELTVADEIKIKCEDIIKENINNKLLMAHGLYPRNKIIFTGDTGNGQRQIAESIACALMVPLFVPRCEIIPNSNLGENGFCVKNFIDYISKERCVIFFDELENFFPIPGDSHETLEIKKVFTSFLMNIDVVAQIRDIFVIGSTQYPDRLRGGLFKKFQDCMSIWVTFDARISRLKKFESQINVPLCVDYKKIARKTMRLNYEYFEEFLRTLLRKFLLSERSMECIINETLQAYCSGVDDYD